MSTVRELVHMVRDVYGLRGDNAQFTDEHIAYLLDKNRGALLAQMYLNKPGQCPMDNVQVIKLHLVDRTAAMYKDKHVISTDNVCPEFIRIKEPVCFFDNDMLRNKMSYVPYERINSVLANLRYKGKLWFCTRYPDRRFIVMTNSYRLKYVDHVYIEAVFNSVLEANKFDLDRRKDYLDYSFHLEESFVPTIVQMTAQALSPRLQELEQQQKQQDAERRRMEEQQQQQ